MKKKKKSFEGIPSLSTKRLLSGRGKCIFSQEGAAIIHLPQCTAVNYGIISAGMGGNVAGEQEDKG